MPDEEKPLARLVVDTNVLIRGILSSTGASALLLNAIYHRRCLVITSRPHLSELHKVLSRPRFVHRYGITPNRCHRLITRLYTLSIFVQPSGHLSICRDPKDDFLIEMALLGQATHLITEDNDLHDDANIAALLHHYGIQLVHAGPFVRTLTQGG